MILTCPNCATRYSVDAAKFPAAGRKVRCAKCSHVWFQAAPGAEPVLAEQVASAPVSVAAPAPVAAPPSPQPEAVRSIPERIAEAASEPARSPNFAATAFAPPKDTQDITGWRSRLALVAGWVALITAVLLIGLSAVRYRQEIGAIWPQSAGVYGSLGMAVKARGLDILADSHRESEDGQVVLAVTGRIVNTSDHALPVPQTVRVTLTDANNRELYHWPFTPAAQTLKPGQSVPFLTRLSSPPAAARHLEVRFAKEGP